MTKGRELTRRRRWRLLGYLPAIAVLVVGAAGGDRVADELDENARFEAQGRFEETTDRVVRAIDQDLENYITDLNDIATFTGIHDPPTPDDFDWFVEQSRYLDPESRQLLIYIERVETDELLDVTLREQQMIGPDVLPLSLHYGTDGPMMFITRTKGQLPTDPVIPMIDVSALPRAREALEQAARLNNPVPLDLDAAFAEIVDPSGAVATSLDIDIEAVMAPVLEYVGASDDSTEEFGYALIMPVHSERYDPAVSGWIVGGLDPPYLLTAFSQELGISVRLADGGPLVAATDPPAEVGHRSLDRFESGGLEFEVEIEAGRLFGLPAGGTSTSGVTRAAGYFVAGLLALVLGLRTMLGARTEEIRDELDTTSHRARHDPLTGLLNRAAMREVVQSLCIKRSDGMIGLLFIDLDRLKIVNDSLGHSVGDTVLQAAAERLQEAVGDVGILSRFGGDEFVVVVDQLGSVDEAVALARQLVVALNPPLRTSQLELSLTASVGIACAYGAEADSETLVRDADAAMYEAKAAGGNGYAVFDETLRERVTDRLQLENALRSAIGGEELEVYFQPIVDVDEDRIVSVEALVRWDRGDLGMVGPLRFLPVANETGMIVQIGEIVADRACAMAAQMREFGAEHPIGVAINLSERELLAPRVVERVGAALARHGVSPDLLTIEINEDVVVDGHGRTLDVLRMLEHLGVRLAIDDFGTGLSSLGHVKRLEMVSTIKIDKTFVVDIDIDEADQAIVSAVVAMSATLGHDVVAEGVERPEQQEMLRRLGVRLMQGHRWSKAVPAEQMLALLERRPVGGSVLSHAGHEGDELTMELAGVGVVAPPVTGEDAVETHVGGGQPVE